MRAIQRSRHSEFSTRLSAQERRREKQEDQQEEEEMENKEIMETSAVEQVSTQLL